MDTEGLHAPSAALPATVDDDRGRHAELASQRGWTFKDLDDPGFVVQPGAVGLLSASDVRRFEAIPIAVKGNQVTVAVTNPDDLSLANRLRPLLPGKTMRLVYANPLAIRRLIDMTHSAASEAERVSAGTRQRQAVTTVSATGGRVSGGPEGESATIFRLIVEQALRERASDIHFEPTEEHLVVRTRVDGKLRVTGRYPSAVAQNLLMLIKVRAQMHTDNFLVPDSGVLYHPGADGKQVDIRVETSPGAWGTSAVMRLQAEIWRELSTLGFSPDNERRFRAAISQPFGVVLATGPTGSGKSTTLYSALRELINPELKIITLENPVEYKISVGASQMSVNDEQGLTFGKGLRSIMRQDPDIVLVGEIRDQETAETAVDAAMTGHLVLSTLHTNDSPGVVPRLTRMGIEPFLVSSSLLCVVGQRLVRRLCDHCKRPVRADAELVARAGFDHEGLPERLYVPDTDGCPHCIGGYRGRLPIHEVMLLSDELADAIADNAPTRVIAAAARAAGMTTMREDGFEKAKAGLTSLAEVNHNTRRKLA